MFIRRCRPAALAVLAALAALAGCDDSPAEKSPQSSTAPKTAGGPKAANLSGDMVAAVSAGKTATAIGVHFVLSAPPTIGKPLPVQVAFVPHRKFLTVRAHFETHDGLTMSTGGVYGPKDDAEPETVLKHELILVPEKEGVFVVTAVVETEGEDGSVSRIFSIPVIVGPAAGTPSAPAPADAPAPAAEKRATS